MPREHTGPATGLRRRLGLAAAGLALGLSALLAPSCGDGSPAEMAAWARAQEDGCRAAEAACAAGRLDEARALLSELVFTAAPEAPLSPAARALSASVAFDLGRVELEDGRPAEALSNADRGLFTLAARAEPPATVLTASLHALRALALEGLARQDEAIAAWEAAQRVHAQLFDQALGAPEAAP